MKIFRHAIILCSIGALFFSCTKDMQPQKIAALAEVTDPYYSMWATDNLLFVTNSSDPEQRKMNMILIYSFKDFQLLKKLGGPELFKIQPAHSVYLFLHPDKFAVNSSGKVSLYDYDFNLQQELEHEGDSFFYVPFGDNFVARQSIFENNIGYYRLNLYDSELNFIKELCRKEFAGRAFSGDFSFEIYRDKVYAAKGKDEFYIEIFDDEGNKLKSISHDCPREKVTQEYKDQHFGSLTNRPGWEKYFKTREEMEEHFRNLIKYPDYFPAIVKIHLADECIYVQTERQIEDQREFWILNLEGKVIKKCMVPFKMKSARICYPYTIRRKRLFQLILDNQTGKWELFSTGIF